MKYILFIGLVFSTTGCASMAMIAKGMGDGLTGASRENSSQSFTPVAEQEPYQEPTNCKPAWGGGADCQTGLEIKHCRSNPMNGGFTCD